MKYIGMSQMHVHSNYTAIIEQPTQDVSSSETVLYTVDKAYMAKTSCNQLFDWLFLLRTVFAHQDRLANYHNVAMSLYDILCQAYALWGYHGMEATHWPAFKENPCWIYCWSSNWPKSWYKIRYNSLLSGVARYDCCRHLSVNLTSQRGNTKPDVSVLHKHHLQWPDVSVVIQLPPSVLRCSGTGWLL